MIGTAKWTQSLRVQRDWRCYSWILLQMRKLRSFEIKIILRRDSRVVPDIGLQFSSCFWCNAFSNKPLCVSKSNFDSMVLHRDLWTLYICWLKILCWVCELDHPLFCYLWRYHRGASCSWQTIYGGNTLLVPKNLTVYPNRHFSAYVFLFETNQSEIMVNHWALLYLIQPISFQLQCIIFECFK